MGDLSDGQEGLALKRISCPVASSFETREDALLGMRSSRRWQGPHGEEARSAVSNHERAGLGRRQQSRFDWKGFVWGVLGRLHDEGMIHDPVGKVKSVVFTEEGLQRAKALFEEMFED
jgi:hypothetical protein